MAMSGNLLLRVDRERSDRTEEIELGKASDRIHQLFLDPTGRHMLVSMRSGDNYYLTKNATKPRLLQRMKGYVVNAVGWNRQNTSETTTSNILIGTCDGGIYETVINSGDDRSFFLTSADSIWKEVFSLGDVSRGRITGIEFERMPHGQPSEYKYLIIVTTSQHRMYQFIGVISNAGEPPIFQKIFLKYEDVPDAYIELPGLSEASRVELFHPAFRSAPKAFAWMCGPGVYYGKIVVEGVDSSRTVLKDAELIPFQSDDSASSQAGPIGVVVTEFHILIVYPTRFMAVCLLNQQLIFDDVLSERFGRFRGIHKDPIKGTIWAFTEQAIFNYAIVDEARDVWKVYLDCGDYKLAQEYAKNNVLNTNTVLTKQAQHLFDEKKFVESAALFAKTFASFEEVALKFVQTGENDALKTFLTKKLAGFSDKDQTQITMVVTWLIELYLNQLGALREAGKMVSDEYDSLQDDFRRLLSYKKVRECLSHNRSTIYDLIASHGDVENMVFFAFLMKDYERVIDHHLQQDQYVDALRVLTKDCRDNVALMYKYSPLLAQKIPDDTVRAWKELRDKLDPKQLIPALVQYDAATKKGQANNSAISYLEFCVEALGNKDQAIHNYLVSQYATNKLEGKLMVYLNVQGEKPDYINYDMKYALRLCSELGLHRACVHIYTTMGLYEEAVDLALKVDVDLAKRNAEKPEDDEELRKKLWLRIARHVVEEEKGIEKAMEFLHECSLLKIEDILPFFPDFVTIDHFKDAICSSLNEYNLHIESLKEEMDQATDSANDIRAEIQTFRNKYAFVQTQDKCTACGFPLVTRFFYVFPCSHKFHADCLVNEMLPHLIPSHRRRVEELQKRLFNRDDRIPTSGPHSPKSNNAQTERTEFDDLVSSECVLCGDYMIASIDKPFISPEEYDDVMESWM